MKTTFKKSVFIAIMAIAFSISQGFAGNNKEVKDENCVEVKAKTEKIEVNPCRNGITDAQVVNYLLALGYTNVSILYWTSCNAVCNTDFSYNTMVIISGGSIIMHEDML